MLRQRFTRPDDVKFKQNFARSMSLTDAMDAKNILCYEMNGTPLPPDNGFPLRLIAPGWYRIANAKWLKRIEVRDSASRTSWILCMVVLAQIAAISDILPLFYAGMR